MNTQIVPFEPPTLPRSNVGNGSRLVIVDNLYYQVADDDRIINYEDRYARNSISEEEAYARFVTLKPGQWQEVDYGWVEDPYLVVIKSPKGGQIEVEHVGMILEGTMFRYVPAPNKKIRLRSPVESKYHVVVIPK